MTMHRADWLDQSTTGATLFESTGSGSGARLEPHRDPVEAYFECITTCSLDDGECVTSCTEILREQG